MINLILIALLLFFSLTDIRNRIISNWVVLPAIILGVLITGHYFWTVIIFSLCAFDYYLGYMRGGDVKLFTMIGAFIGGYAILSLLISIFLIRWYLGLKKEKGIAVPVSPFALESVLIILLQQSANILKF